MNTTDAVTTLTDNIIASSKAYNGDDNTNYPYAFGMLVGTMKTLLDELVLDNNQLQVLNNFVSRRA